MASLRPARTCRDVDKPAWTRWSKKKPRKSYVKARPHTNLYHMDMGVDRDDYDVVVKLVSKVPIQLRDGALESARLAVHKYMQRVAKDNYKFKILPYPHIILREHRMLTGAGADRLSSGMKKAFGRPTDRAARLKKGQTLFVVRTYSKNVNHVLEAYRRARCKLSGRYGVEIEQITPEEKNA